MIVAPTQQQVYAVLQPFIIKVTGLDPSLVIQGLPNRTAMPAADPGFVVMQAVFTRRLRTNVDTWDQTNPEPASTSQEQGTGIDVQLDCYGASSGDWAVMLSTLLRDEIGCLALAPYCQPLYVDDARLAPLTDSEDQYEQRWTLTARLQYNPVTTTAQDFMSTAEVTSVNVDEAYPP